MKLTKEQAGQILSKLNNYRDSRKACAICGHNQWALNDVLFEVREFNNGNLIVGAESAVMPMVSLSCTNCGNTLFLSAIKLGVLAPQLPSNEEK